MLLRGLAYVANSSAESVRMSARSSALANSARRALWLKTWQGDIASTVKLCGIPLTGDLLFGPGLEAVLDRPADKNKPSPIKRKLPVQSKKGFCPQSRMGVSKPQGQKKPLAQRERGSNFWPSRPAPQSSMTIWPWWGKFGAFLPQWKAVSSSQFILGIVRRGYRLGFLRSSPHRLLVMELPRCVEKIEALLESLAELENQNVVRRVPVNEMGEGFYHHVFVVQKHSGKYTLILNLKPLNQSVVCHGFNIFGQSIATAKLLHGIYKPQGCLSAYPDCRGVSEVSSTGSKGRRINNPFAIPGSSIYPILAPHFH